MTQGAIVPKEEWQGTAYLDAVPIPLDEIDEQVLALMKEYGFSFTELMDDTYYCDVGVMYAKMANDKAFEGYNQYVSMSEEQRSKHVMEYGEPKPYQYVVVTAEEQAEAEKTELQKMYKNGGKLIG